MGGLFDVVFSLVGKWKGVRGGGRCEGCFLYDWHRRGRAQRTDQIVVV